MTNTLHIEWLRAAALFTTAHQALEAELLNMKSRKVPQDFIDRKDQQIEQLVNFYNTTEEIISAYRLALAQAKTENHFLTEMLAKKISIQELLSYKPSKAVIIYNKETGDQHTLSAHDQA